MMLLVGTRVGAEAAAGHLNHHLSKNHLQTDKDEEWKGWEALYFDQCMHILVKK